jgi:hypothetical protein
MKKRVIIPILVIFIAVAAISLFFLNKPKQTVTTVEGPCSNDVAILDRFKDLPCSEATQKTNNLIRTSWGGAPAETICVGSQEHFNYMVSLMQMPWVDAFKKTVGDFDTMRDFCFNSNSVLYVKDGNLDDSFYLLGYYSTKNDSKVEFNPQFRGFGSMGNRGCIPSLTQHGYFYECDATTENRGEPPFINENAKPLYAKFEYDDGKFILIDSVNKELFQEPE